MPYRAIKVGGQVLAPGRIVLDCNDHPMIVYRVPEFATEQDGCCACWEPPSEDAVEAAVSSVFGGAPIGAYTYDPDWEKKTCGERPPMTWHWPPRVGAP